MKKSTLFSLLLTFPGLAGSASRAQTGEPGVAPVPEIVAPPAAAPQDVQPKPVRRARISGGVMAGLLLTKVNPVYPAEARAAGVSGSVVLHATIGKDGMVENLQAVSGPDVLVRATVEAVRQWTYKPYLLNGEPTEVDTTILVNFNLAPAPQTP